MNQAVRRDQPSEAEELLLLPSWGAWAREGWSGRSYPAWVVMMIKQGYRETYAKPYYPPITEDHALWLDRMIAKLPEQIKDVLYCMYVLNMSRNLVAKHQKRNPSAVAQDRDWALAFLAGALQNT